MFYPGKDNGAGSCEDAINPASKFPYHNFTNKSLSSFQARLNLY